MSRVFSLYRLVSRVVCLFSIFYLKNTKKIKNTVLTFLFGRSYMRVCDKYVASDTKEVLLMDAEHEHGFKRSIYTLHSTYLSAHIVVDVNLNGLTISKSLYVV